MALQRQAQWQMGVIAVVALTTVAFHYGFLTPAHLHSGFLHAIHGRLCYIPIILGAIWFGVRGGLSVAASIALLTLPYPRLKGITDSNLLLNEYTEMVFYIAIGLTAGILIEQQWRERRRRESLQRELAHKERLSSLGQMAAGLAHEIKNPLGSIQGAAEILSDDVPRDSRGGELLDVLSKESRRLGAVVDHFLGFARPRPLELAAVRINEVVEATARQLELDAVNAGVRISRELSDGLPAIEADAAQLHQVFLNIVLNAVAASPDGGRVVVRTASHGSGVAVSVSDDGDGIEADNLSRVFDPFFTTKESGTGLGLSISHAIVDDHGGRIAIDSEPGCGTTVTVVLPAKPGMEAGGGT